MSTGCPFLAKNASLIQSALSCFDRVIFKGHLPISYVEKFQGFVDYTPKLLRAYFLQHVAPQSTNQLVEHARQTAATHQRSKRHCAYQGKNGPPSHPLTIKTAINLAGIYQDSGETQKVIPFFEEVLSQRRVNSGMDSTDTLESILLLAQAYVINKEKFSEAAVLFRDALAIQEKKSPDSCVFFDTKSVLGGVLLSQKKYLEAKLLPHWLRRNEEE